MSQDKLWWPDSTLQALENHVMGSGVHRGRKGGDTTEHLFTLKQLSGFNTSKLIWACACGETRSRVIAFERP